MRLQEKPVSLFSPAETLLDNLFYLKRKTRAVTPFPGDVEFINYGQKPYKDFLFVSFSDESEIFLIKTSQIQQFFLLQWKNNNVGLFSTLFFFCGVFQIFFIQQHSCYKSFIVEEKNGRTTTN